MTTDFTTGRLSNLLFYSFESSAIIIYALMKGVFSSGVTIGMILYIVLTGIFLYLAPVRIPMKHAHYSRVQITLLMVLTVILCYTFESCQIFLCAMYLRVIIAFVYMDERLCRFQTGLTMLFTIGMWVINFPGISDKPTVIEMTMALISLYAACWILSNLARILAFDRRKSFEQERSLDDLLKVVETKCEEAQQATRSKSEFLSNMSHEIRTPINTVLGMNEMILRETTDADIRKYAGNVENSGKMLLALINDILDFSKIESGKMEIVPVKYQVSSVLNDLISMLKPKAEDKGLVLELEANRNIPNLLIGDEVRIRQIATNLLTNAIKYTASGTVTLIIDFRQTDENTIAFYLAVRDTGTGIRKEDQTKLFSAFQRVDEKRNRNIEGTGLGLSITNRLVELMNGTIGVESVYGEGSLFHVTIPQKIADAEPMGSVTQYAKNLESQQYQETFTAPEARILVVDDNSMNLAVVEGLLKQTCIQIETASSGEECLRLLRQKSYHLLLLDHMMPDMDGIETLNHIKEEHLSEDMPIIALTANAISGAREMYLEHGFQDYLSKPIVGGSLERILYAWLPQDFVRCSTSTKVSKPEEKKLEEKYSEKTASEDVLSLDHKAALEYCAGDEDLYQQVLALYIEQGEEYIAGLSEYYALRDWEKYRTTAHAVKSTSRTIGAIAFSEIAATMEAAARDEDDQILLEEHASFLEKYRLLLDNVSGQTQ